ncbi:MAG: hypothetical protein ACREDO_13100 [Methyloceanibacter sp.]
MLKAAPVHRSVLCLAMLMLLAGPGRAAEPEPEPEPGAAPPPADLECHNERVTGSGPSFTSARADAETAAKQDWLKKAQAIFPEATFETAREANLSCAVQGLYSKCFAAGIPCRPKVAASKPGAPAPEASDPK